jgi:hypothetical protein
MTLHGQQFTLKRRALRMIHQAFMENGIKIAVPTVQVSGENADGICRCRPADARNARRLMRAQREFPAPELHFGM